MGGASSVQRSKKLLPAQCPRADPTPDSLLLALPDAEFARVLGHLADRPSALRLRGTSRDMSLRIQRDGEACRGRMLYWLAEMTSACTISNEGRTLTRLGGGGFAWAAASLLSTVGASSFAIRVDKTAADWGGMHIGVCDASGHNAWGLSLATGKMSRRSRDGDGLAVPRKHAVNKFASRTTPPPAGWPDGHGTQVLLLLHLLISTPPVTSL